MISTNLSRFDWYQASISDECDLSGVDLLLHLSDAPPDLVPGRFGFSRGWRLSRGGSTLATVFQSDGRSDHVLGTGGDAPEVAAALRGRASHAVSRADACVDFSGGEQFFQTVRQLAVSSFSGRVSMTDYVEHGLKGDSSTFYIGSSKSETRVRLYEKGKQDEKYASDVVRLEVQVRPGDRSRKDYASSVSPDGFFGFARWSANLFEGVTAANVPLAPKREERVSDLDGALDACVRQYGKRLLELEQLHHGDAAAAWVDLVSRMSVA